MILLYSSSEIQIGSLESDVMRFSKSIEELSGHAQNDLINVVDANFHALTIIRPVYCWSFVTKLTIRTLLDGKTNLSRTASWPNIINCHVMGAEFSRCHMCA